MRKTITIYGEVAGTIWMPAVDCTKEFRLELTRIPRNSRTRTYPGIALQSIEITCLRDALLHVPKNPALIGQNLIAVPDVEGKPFRKEIVDRAKAHGSGWVDYVYLNPETNRQEHKTTYFQKMGDIILCCGVYKDYSHEGD